jgi:PilZ domain
MGRRSEPRIAISFPVHIRGLDARKNPFSITAHTFDISYSGASLKGLTDLVEVGAKLELCCGEQIASYRVQWIGRSGSPRAGRIGVRCLEIGKYIWGVPPKEVEADTYDPTRREPLPLMIDASASAYTSNSSWRGPDRRQFARHVCCIAARVSLQHDSGEMSGKITDISLGGCYVEMLSPLPVGTVVQLSLSPAESTLHLLGKVRSSQTGFGMGVVFVGMDADDFEALRRFAPPTDGLPVALKLNAAAAVPPRENRVLAKPSAPPASVRTYGPSDSDSLDLSSTADALDALVHLLLRKEIFTRGELAEELEKARIVK